ncbi:Fc.00g027970.m01.CDS01 [Cosmosporella sp. VM-42]
MPLHLLGKKSWNVYNADNVARVQRDEAVAKAAEEAEEQRMQEKDAQRRLAILRGEAPPPLEDTEPEAIEGAPSRDHGSGSQHGSLRRKRKLAGEDDTDFELRVAKERNELTGTKIESGRKPTSSAPIVDHSGHIDLFGSELTRAHAEKNEEADKESSKKKQSYEDQYTMRFANAAGRDKDSLTKAWYSQSDSIVSAPPLRNVWGNEDPRRKERDAQRIVANDPLAMMKRGAGKVRELNKERRKEREEHEEELRALKREERHKEKKKRRHEERERNVSLSGRHGTRRRSLSMERKRRREDEPRDRRRRNREEERRRRRNSRSPDRDKGERTRNCYRGEGNNY